MAAALHQANRRLKPAQAAPRHRTLAINSDGVRKPIIRPSCLEEFEWPQVGEFEVAIGVLGKRRDLTAVVITYVDPHDWYVAGRSLAELGQSSFYFDVKVVDETNTKAEKARYVAEAFETFERLLGNVHPESYVYVQDVRATAYGFGGRTQEYRFQHPNP